MAAVVLSVRALLPHEWPDWQLLLTEVGAVACSYVAVLYLAHGVRMRRISAWLLDLVRQREPMARERPMPATGPARALAGLEQVIEAIPSAVPVPEPE
jgi:hypothetical protein